MLQKNKVENICGSRTHDVFIIPSGLATFPIRLQKELGSVKEKS